MRQTPHRIPPLRQLIDTDLPAGELQRLRRVDALLHAARPRLRLVSARDEQTHELRLTYGELSLVYRALQAARTLGALPEENELLDDTIQLVDQALNGALR
jgi:hypothetical protein